MTEEMVGEEQGAFRVGRRCVDQSFTLRQLNEKMREKKKSVFGFNGFATGL